MPSDVVETASPLLWIRGHGPILAHEDADVAAQHDRLRLDIGGLTPPPPRRADVDNQRLPMTHLLSIKHRKHDDTVLAYYIQCMHVVLPTICTYVVCSSLFVGTTQLGHWITNVCARSLYCARIWASRTNDELLNCICSLQSSFCKICNTI